jgi:hypothetical protein
VSEISQSLTTTNPWFYYPLIVGLILAAGMVGNRFGRRFHDPDSQPRVIDYLSSVQAALIGLLSLMIAFTFSLSLSRYEARQKAVLSEATAISETRELAALLPTPQAAAADRLLGAYVATRIELGEVGTDLSRRRVIIGRSNALERALWAQAMAAGAGRDGPLRAQTSLFVSSLNVLEDRDEERLAADHNQVPLAVFVTLYGLALLASGYSGYAIGVKGSRGMDSNAILGIAIATVITLIADVDTPGSGLVGVSQDPLKNIALTAPAIR